MSNETRKPSAREAVESAMRALRAYLPWSPINVRVEEVVPPDHPQGWLITLSHLEPAHESDEARQHRHLFRRIVTEPAPTERVYKVFEVDPTTGEAGAMKMRDR